MSNANLSRQRAFWTRRALSWDHGAANNPGLVQVVDRVLLESAPQAGFVVVDLGCGSGQLSLRLAAACGTVIAVDISPAMIDLLESHARSAGLSNIDGRSTPIEHFSMEPESVDLVVSNYALHHLQDNDKATVVENIATWLRPGGRVVVGDMMFGRGGDARDRQVIAAKLAVMVRRGPAGWWRIAKNAVRYLVRYQERPISMSKWVEIFTGAGLVDVEAIPVVAEAAVVRGARPRQ